MLKDRESGIEVRSINVAEKSDDPDKYSDLRSQLVFDLRDWLLAGGTLIDDERLKEELIAAMYEFDIKGRIKVTKKKEEKKLLDGRSPDRRDALTLAIYEPKARYTIGGQNIFM